MCEKKRKFLWKTLCFSLKSKNRISGVREIILAREGTNLLHKLLQLILLSRAQEGPLELRNNPQANTANSPLVPNCIPVWKWQGLLKGGCGFQGQLGFG